MIICLALGSNIGERKKNIDAAVEQLSKTIKVIAVSGCFQTAPVDCPAGSEYYLNGALIGDTDLTAQDVIKLCLETEQKAGRIRSDNDRKNAPRIIDIDLLLYGQEIISQSPEIIIPHPRMHERMFVLEPLSEIAGSIIHPVFSKSIAELFNELKDRNEA